MRATYLVHHILFDLWSLYYLVKIKIYEARHYAIFYTLLLLPPC